LISNKFCNGGERPEQAEQVPLCTCSSTPSVWALKPPSWALVHKTTYAPMIYTALCPVSNACISITRASGREFFWPQMALAYRLDAISQGPKNSQIPGPNPSHLPSQWICTHPKHYARDCINHRCIKSYFTTEIGTTSLFGSLMQWEKGPVFTSQGL
jgi:hypothetical protein